MAGIIDWLDTAYVVLDNPHFKSYDNAKHQVGFNKRRNEKKDLAKAIEKWEMAIDSEERILSSISQYKDEEVQKWLKKQKKKNKKPKAKLTHYEKVKKKLKKKTDEKRLKKLKGAK